MIAGIFFAFLTLLGCILLKLQRNLGKDSNNGHSNCGHAANFDYRCISVMFDWFVGFFANEGWFHTGQSAEGAAD